jgi:hypothetical protein
MTIKSLRPQATGHHAGRPGAVTVSAGPLGRIENYRKDVERAKAFADLMEFTRRRMGDRHGYGRLVGGMQQLMVLTMDNPQFVIDLLELIHQWNKARMEVVLRASGPVYPASLVRRLRLCGAEFLPKCGHAPVS